MTSNERIQHNQQDEQDEQRVQSLRTHVESALKE
jgi:hypothetical protein